MWEELVDPGAIAILTPFSNGSVHRPAADDIARLCALGIDLYDGATETDKGGARPTG
jgi:hypothetical protein